MAVAVAVEVIGDQRPRLWCGPDADEVASSADDAIELAAACGLVLDDWQQWILRQSLGERADGKWCAYDVGVVVARQNGKGAVLMARELAGALLFDERLIVHSAHELDTARDHLKKLDALAEESPYLRALLPADGIKWGRGYEEARFTNGSVIRFKSRTRKGGRGLSGDLVVFDEAFELDDTTLGAMQPLLRARPNPQVWYASSVVDQTSMPHGVVLAGLRARAKSDSPGRLAYMEWSNPDGLLDDVPAGKLRDVISDPAVWAAANPALGIRVDPEQMATEVDSMPLRQFAVECLSVGDWPDVGPDGRDEGPITADMWEQAADPAAVMLDPVVLGVDVAPDRSSASIVAAGRTAQGRTAVEVIDVRRGVAWVLPRLSELVARHDVSAVVKDGHTLLDGIDDVDGTEVLTTGAADMADGCAYLVDLLVEDNLRHLRQQPLDAAVEQTGTRSLSGGFAWKRKPGDNTSVPLVAATLAVWGLRDRPDAHVEPFVFVS